MSFRLAAGSFGFSSLLHMLRWIRGQSIQELETIPLLGEKKKVFSPGRVKGEGGVTPLVAVESEGNMKNLILWRQRQEDDVWGALIYFCGSTEGPE